MCGLRVGLKKPALDNRAAAPDRLTGHMSG